MNYKFEKLTPVDNVELEVYNEAIDYVFKNDDVKNIAISGAYGAGKSSIIESYKKKDPTKHFLHISLAHFEDPDNYKTTEERVKENVLEGKILNQLIHQIPVEHIAQSKFKIKRNIDKNNVIKMSLCILIFIILVFHVIFFNSWRNYINLLNEDIVKSFFGIMVMRGSRLVSGSILISLMFYFIYEIICIQKNKNIFKKLNVQGNEIEIFEEDEDSYFDKYLNEVIYLFENCGSDVIVFEDMDRFNTNRIFGRLREINDLVNKRFFEREQPPLRFFYLVKDDIFVSKDRTKFFDYIIPVVPVVDGSNSYDKFIELFNKNDTIPNPDDRFVQGLSLYVDDMRLLKNIYNEYIVYYERLNTIELDYNKMLAIITYKNLFPRDFSDLQLNRGYVYTIFSNKNKFIEREIQHLEKMEEQYEKTICGIKSEALINLDELDLLKDAKKREANNVYYRDRMRAYEEWEAKVYPKRKEIIENKNNNKLSDISAQLNILRKKIDEIKNSKLCDIINRKNSSEIFNINYKNEIGDVNEFNEIKGSESFDLLKYLISNGYIDESYSDYMTYFYPNSLTTGDKIFLRSVTDRRAKEYAYRLNNADLVFSRLSIVDFKQEEILNFCLIDHILVCDEKQCIITLIEQLKETKKYDFIREFWAVTKYQDKLVRCISEYWPAFFELALSESIFTDNHLHELSVCVLHYCSNNQIVAFNEDDVLSKYISEQEDYLLIDNPQWESLISGFILLNVKFQNIDYIKKDSEAFKAIYENDLYELNSDNIRFIIKELYDESEYNIIHMNYSIVLQNSDNFLNNYIENSIDEYISAILNICEGEIFDNEEAALKLINNSNISKKNIIEYIQALKTSISSLVLVDNHVFWDELLPNNMAYTESNILKYYGSNGINQLLTNFINNSDCTLDFSNIYDKYPEQLREDFFDNVIINNDINDEKYQQIIVTLGFYFESFDLNGISSSKLKILIDYSIIRMNIETLLFIRNNYKSNVIHFICKNIDDYIKIIRDILDETEILALLDTDISDEHKLLLLRMVRTPISVIDKRYSESIIVYILNNNLHEKDLRELFKNYSDYSIEVKSILTRFAEKYIDSIYDYTDEVSIELTENLLRSIDLIKEQKIGFIIEMINKISKDELKHYMAIAGLNDYLKIFDPKLRPKFEINTLNRDFLQRLKQKKYIGDYEEDTNKPGYYKIKRYKRVEKEILD